MKKVLIGLLALGSISSFAQGTDNRDYHNEYDRKISIAAVVFDCATEYKNLERCKNSIRNSFSLDVTAEDLLIAVRQELVHGKMEDLQVSDNTNRFSELFNEADEAFRKKMSDAVQSKDDQHSAENRYDKLFAEADEAFRKKMNDAEQAKRSNRFDEILKQLI